MSLKSTLDQYHKHVLRLAAQKQTANTRKGIAWYTAAAERVQALLEAETPAWVGLEFKRSRIL
jgi:hypothetical protein